MSGSAYARLVPKIHRSKRLPKIDRPWRPRMIAWAGPSAFYPNRFYEQDKWYKARIDKPEIIPKLHIIDPSNHFHSINDVLSKETEQRIDIGFKPHAKVAEVPKTNDEKAVLERKSRKMELFIDLSEINNDSLDIYYHFSVYDDLFGKGVMFENTQKIRASFEDFEIVKGNVISAMNTATPPNVNISSIGGQGYNTILMVNLDGNPYEKEGSLVHWMVTNIPDGQELSAGVETFPYLQTLPFYGTGYHRVAFLTFRHNDPIDIPSCSSADLVDRVMNVSKFYKENEQTITPSALLFFQTSYDNSVKEVMHKNGWKSPLYQYEYNEPLKPAQKEFPVKSQPFDLYLDMYRDPKDVEAELLEERLKRAQLDDYQAPKWLDTNYNENRRKYPAWQHQRMINREGKYKSLYENSIKP